VQARKHLVEKPDKVDAGGVRGTQTTLTVDSGVAGMIGATEVASGNREAPKIRNEIVQEGKH